MEDIVASFKKYVVTAGAKNAAKLEELLRAVITSIKPQLEQPNLPWATVLASIYGDME